MKTIRNWHKIIKNFGIGIVSIVIIATVNDYYNHSEGKKSLKTTGELETKALPFCILQVPKGSQIISKSEEIQNTTLQDMIIRTNTYLVNTGSSLNIIGLDMELAKNVNEFDYDIKTGLLAMAEQLRSNLNVREITVGTYIKGECIILEGTYVGKNDTLRILATCLYRFPHIGTIITTSPIERKEYQNFIVNSVQYSYLVEDNKPKVPGTWVKVKKP